jgi:hypothetical protein
MLSLIESAQQIYLKKKGANEYPLILTVLGKGGEKLKYEIMVFAYDEEEALGLGEVLQKRLTEKALSKGLMYDLGLNVTDIKDNKLGLILPWKNIVLKRSLNNGVALPMRRSYSMLRQIGVNVKSFKKIPLISLTEEQIKNRQKKCVYSFFVNSGLLLMALILMLQAVFSTTGFFSVYSYSATLLIIYCSMVFFQIHKTQQILINWRARNHGG